MKKYLVFSPPFIISIIFFIIPFFWLKPGEMDLGGDSSRLYFYNPLAYLAAQSLYGIAHSGLGGENLSYYGIPFFLLLGLVKSFIHSPTILICAFHGMSLSIAFVSIYLIVKELLRAEIDEKPYKKVLIEIAGIIAGLFYTLSPMSILNWGYVILTYNQVFLNPLLFYLLLKFFITRNMRYLLVVLLVSFIFSPNFTYVGAPPFFSFYPLAFVFLFLYTKYIKRTAIPVKKLFLGLILFLLIQAFQLLPLVMGLLSPGNPIHEVVFSQEGKIGRGFGYFSSIASLIKLSISLQNLPQLVKPYPLSWVFMAFPFVIIGGFFWNRRKTFLLSAVFFLIGLFFYTGNITNAGISLYASFYNIPGFAMFRNFYGQWQWAYLFFFTIFLGQAIAVVLTSINRTQRVVLIGILVIILLSSSWPFMSGKLHDTTHWQSKGISSHVQMDPEYEKLLSYVHNLPIDGKILSLPLTDPGYQVLKGVNDGAYEGPSTITYIAGRNEFMGVEEFEFFSPSLLLAARDKNYEMFKTILGMLNIRYIFYNEDPYIYTKNYPGQPYSNVRKYLPDTQEAYKDFIKNLGLKELKTVGGKYHLYEIEDKFYLPHIYAAKRTAYWNDFLVNLSLPISLYKEDKRIAFYDVKNIFKNYKNIFDDVLLKAQNKSPIFDFFKKKKLNNFVSPTVSQKLYSPIYPLAVLREKKDLERFVVVDDSYIDRNIYFAEKRINELTKWSPEIPILGGVKSTTRLERSWKEPKLWEFSKYKTYNSWEITLVRYQRAMEKLVSILENTSRTDYSAVTNNTNKIELKSILLLHKDRLRVAILEDEKKSTEEKRYLLRLVEGMFIDILAKLNLLLPDYKNVPYEISHPVEAGTYQVYVNKRDIESLQLSDIGITVEGKNLTTIPSDNSAWLRFEDIKTTKKNKLPLFLTVKKEPNLVEKTSWEALEKNEIGTNSAMLSTAYDFLGDQTGLVREITSWRPDSMYIISFDYYTDNDNFLLSVFERGGIQMSPSINNVYRESLRTPQWKNFIAVFLSGKDAKSAFIQINKNQEDLRDLNSPKNDKKIEIKNLLVVRFPDPQIILKQIVKPEEKTLPNLTFTKINQTKYKVEVSGTKDPYALVLSQKFNQKWKVFLAGNDNNANTIRGAAARTIGGILKEFMHTIGRDASDQFTKITKNYGNGTLREAVHQDSFLDTNTFETWGKDPIAEKTHLPINGYANAWYIEPKDVHGKTKYTLIIEMTSQKTFYASVIVSLIGLTLIVVLFLKSRKT